MDPTDARDDGSIEDALKAVQEGIISRCPSLLALPCPNDVLYATLLWTNRLLARRNSPDGIVGVADLGVATIAKMDKDILEMLSPYVAQVM